MKINNCSFIYVFYEETVLYIYVHSNSITIEITYEIIENKLGCRNVRSMSHDKRRSVHVRKMQGSLYVVTEGPVQRQAVIRHVFKYASGCA